MSLKEMLLHDFGLDLPITGGLGQSPNDPIIISSSSPEEVAHTEVNVLRCIGKGRRIFWRTLEKSSQAQGGLWLEKIKIETKQITEKEIITQRENYYFLVETQALEEKPIPVAVKIGTGKAAISLPTEIGWFHFDSIIDNEPSHPGLGQTLYYGAPGSKVTIYVYNSQLSDIPDGVDSEIIRGEFKKAVLDILKLNQEVKLTGQPQKGETLLLQGIEQGENLGLLALKAHNSKFIKLRLTHFRDPLLLDLATESLIAFDKLYN